MHTSQMPILVARQVEAELRRQLGLQPSHWALKLTEVLLVQQVTTITPASNLQLASQVAQGVGEVVY